MSYGIPECTSFFQGGTMQRLDRMRTKLLFAMTFWLFAVVQITAENGRDFAGFYDLTEVSDLGDTVQANFRVRVLNYSGADVTSATVTLESSLVLAQEYGSFYAVSIADRNSAFLKPLYITLSKQEHDSWRQGRRPSLHVEYVGQSGQTLRRPVELVQMPLGEEQ